MLYNALLPLLPLLSTSLLFPALLWTSVQVHKKMHQEAWGHVVCLHRRRLEKIQIWLPGREPLNLKWDFCHFGKDYIFFYWQTVTTDHILYECLTQRVHTGPHLNTWLWLQYTAPREVPMRSTYILCYKMKHITDTKVLFVYLFCLCLVLICLLTS